MTTRVQSYIRSILSFSCASTQITHTHSSPLLLHQRHSNDPNRFTNRGGQLQKQLKLRKQLEKELPKVEKELKTVLLQWEEDHERYFVVNDARYLDAMESQMMERFQEKEQEKMKKVILMCGLS